MSSHYFGQGVFLALVIAALIVFVIIALIIYVGYQWANEKPTRQQPEQSAHVSILKRSQV